MQNRLRLIGLTLMLALMMFLPLTVLAQEDAGDVGTAVALSLIGLVLLVIFAVAVIGAVGLGIIGIGYALSSSEDG